MKPNFGKNLIRLGAAMPPVAGGIGGGIERINGENVVARHRPGVNWAWSATMRLNYRGRNLMMTIAPRRCSIADRRAEDRGLALADPALIPVSEENGDAAVP